MSGILTITNLLEINITFLLKFNKSSSCEWSPNLQTFTYNWWCNKFILWYFFIQFFISSFIEKYLIIQLITDFSFRPLLQKKKKHYTQIRNTECHIWRNVKCLVKRIYLLFGFTTARPLLLFLSFLWLLCRPLGILLRGLK